MLPRRLLLDQPDQAKPDFTRRQGWTGVLPRRLLLDQLAQNGTCAKKNFLVGYRLIS